ncbi:hypothetical protein GCM10022254_48850 [Actinomadura meridiana]|uniref:YncE family protein n=1 Tax=Actinomadura meridiana TaxID=559626 RepID=A0ABP8CBR8_9ACTN
MGCGGRSRAAAFRIAVALTLSAGAVAGCESSVPFYPPGKGPRDGPVVGLGAPAPYLPARPGAPPTAPLPEPAPAPAPDRPGGGRRARLYVAKGRVIDIVDLRTLRIVGHLRTGMVASQIVPSWDLRRWWAADRAHGVLVPVSAGGPGRPVWVTGAVRLYFSPDGHDALVLAQTPNRIDVRDRATMLPRASVPLPCRAGHAGFTLDGSTLVATCASTGTLVRVDRATRRVTGTIRLPRGARPGDLRLSPDGTAFHIADPATGGLWLVDARRFALLGFVPTAPGARGLAISRDARRLFVVGGGVLTAVDFATQRVTSRGPLPGRGSPVPGGVSPDGTALWLADPTGLVYAVSTSTGRVLRTFRISGRPVGLCVHPPPGRYSLGGTGVYR